MFTWRFGRNVRASRVPEELEKMDGMVRPEVSALLAGAGVPTFRQALPKFHAEIDRARRYSRPLAVMLVTDARAASPNAPRRASREAVAPLGPGSPLIAAMLATLLREIVRDADVVTFSAADGRCVVLMPEISPAESELALHRVGSICAARLSFPVRAELATFPQDGLTLGDLLEHATAQAAVPKPAVSSPMTVRINGRSQAV